jgi:competence protein ComEC
VHIVSASGLHVGLIALLLLWALSLFPIPRWLQLAVLACVLALYAVASGLHPPVVRASIMAFVLAAAYLVRREPDMMSALALAAVVQILWDARAVFDPGFQISFVVVAAFALFSFRASAPKGSPREKLKLNLRNGLGGAILATVASAPLAAYSFGSVSFTSVVANLAIVVVLPVLVVGAMLAHLLSFAVAPLGVGLMVGLVGPLAGWLDFVTESLGGEWAAVSVPAFSGYWLLLVYGLMLVLWRPRLRPA